MGVCRLSVCVSVCGTFVVFTDCESCTRPISTNPAFMEAGEYGLTRGTCFVARRLEVVAVAWLLCISWCVWVGRIFLCLFSCFFFIRTYTACCKYESTLPHLPLYYYSINKIGCTFFFFPKFLTWGALSLMQKDFSGKKGPLVWQRTSPTVDMAYSRIFSQHFVLLRSIV